MKTIFMAPRRMWCFPGCRGVFPCGVSTRTTRPRASGPPEVWIVSPFTTRDISMEGFASYTGHFGSDVMPANLSSSTPSQFCFLTSRERSLMFYIQNAVLHRWHILIRWWSVLINNGCSAQLLENGGFNKLYLKWAQEQCSVLFKNTSTHIYLFSLPPHTWNL